MGTLFISDVHLRSEEPRIYCGFLRFLQEAALGIDALYILGDLFEIWIGDEDPNPLNRKIEQGIKNLVDSGVPCFFIHGNRDFLIGEKFSRESGITLLPEVKVLDLYGRRVLIMHGDTLCTDDIRYQIFRATVRKPWIRTLFLSLPLFIRSWIVSRIQASRKSTKNRKFANITDVNPRTVKETMNKYQVQWLIHGHTHRSEVHKTITNGKSVFRIVLSEWSMTGSMIKVTPQSVEMIYFPL